MLIEVHVGLVMWAVYGYKLPPAAAAAACCPSESADPRRLLRAPTVYRTFHSLAYIERTYLNKQRIR